MGSPRAVYIMIALLGNEKRNKFTIHEDIATSLQVYDDDILFSAMPVERLYEGH